MKSYSSDLPNTSPKDDKVDKVHTRLLYSALGLSIVNTIAILTIILL